ncbi:MAG: beta-mannosidase [Chitinophagaceae bacterium]|nr:beta-mannosidase [Chitinophagaceae bacterium]
MKKYCLIVTLFFASVMLIAQKPAKLIDPHATPETKALYLNLHRLSQKHILFGHQHATEYGHGWQGEEGRSDVKSVTGSHPAVIGVDFMGLSGRPREEIEKEKRLLRKNIGDTYDRGGITTVSWHFSNPASAGGFYWKDSISAPAVKLMVPGASHHEQYKAILKDVADLALTTKGKDGKLVPMIFRPYHELDGWWFWWGAQHCTREELITVWRFTVSYLRDSLGVHNFIYAFSPDCLYDTEAEYLDRYPGDMWVDMVGVDNYNDFGRYGRYNVDSGILKLKIVSDYAKKTGKLAAFTETGLESIPNVTWWTGTLLRALKKAGGKFAYVLVWRNDVTSPTHYYAPFPGHVSEKDFIKFFNDPYTLFEKDLDRVYQIRKQP